MTVLIGGFPLQETRSAEVDAGTVQIFGRHSLAIYTETEVRAAHDNVQGMRDLIVPVLFDEKTQLSGFYRVTSASSRVTRYAGGAVQHVEWSLTLAALGSSRDVEVDSRVPRISRSTDHGVVPVYWHAAASGYTSYYTGTSSPSAYVTRTSADGAVVAHLGIPSTAAPRWTVATADYLRGSSKLFLDGIRRIGPATPNHVTWEVNNGLVRLTSAASGVSGAFEVSCWDPGGWWSSVKAYQITVAGAGLTAVPEMTVLRNDPEEVLVRLSYPTAPQGRVAVDLGLRRGSRFVTGVVKRHSSSTLGIKRTLAEAATSETGRIRASVNDAHGNRYVLGSAKSFTADTAVGGISKASVTTLDFFAGHAVGGSSAVAGDAPADLLQQYLGSAGERATVVRR